MQSPFRASRARASLWLAAVLTLLSPIVLIASATDTRPSPREYSTSLGESRRVVLGRQAVANLNTNSALSVTSAPEICDIVMEQGEALFEVRHDPARTVRVTAGNTILQTAAASFAVRLFDADHVNILVRRGNVTLPAADVKLAANESAQIAHTEIARETLAESEVGRRLQWTDGYLAFRGETLREVAEEFNRYNPQRMVIEDPSIRELRIGGKYQSTDPEGFVRALRPLGVQRVDAYPAGSSGELIRLVSVTRAAP